MKKHQFPGVDNRGASLIMVIIGLAFAFTLGAIVVSAALLNNNMKATDRKSKSNFYSAEAAMNEIRTGLEEDAAESLSAAYQAVMTNYLTMDEDARNNLLHDKLVEEMAAVLEVSPADNEIPLTKLNRYLKETKKAAPSSNGAEVTGTPRFDTTASQDYILLKNVTVSFQTNQFTTAITTDIKINIPKNAENVCSQTPYLDYALIADQALNADFTDYQITGSVYAGSGGIHTGQGSQMTINGSRIISKGDIVVKDLGNLNIAGSDTEVWANNLLTTQTDKEQECSNETVVDVTGTCYLKDDLVLDARKSRVTMKGKYYGYSSGSDADSNSSVIINASDAQLDLSGLDKLYLAGRSFLSLEDGAGAVTYYKDDIYGAGAGANCDILTGESLAIKGSQNAYLLPSKFIAVGHNPVSWNEYKAYYDPSAEKMAVIPSDAIVFDNYDIPSEERKLLYYLEDTCPVKKAFYKFGMNDNVVYYYLNFKSQAYATAYFKNYMKCYPDRVYNGFPIGSVKINSTPGACITAGNIMTFDTGMKLISGTGLPFTNSYRKTFSNLTTTLLKNYAGSGNTEDDIVFENILDTDKLYAAGNNHPDGKILEKNITVGGEDCYICIVDNRNTGPYDYNLEGKKGIVVTTGDINVNRDFTGLILSNGTIELNAAAVTADSDMLDLILSSDSETADYFKAYTSSDQEGIDVSDLIEYENWRKN